MLVRENRRGKNGDENSFTPLISISSLPDIIFLLVYLNIICLLHSDYSFRFFLLLLFFALECPGKE